MSSRRRYLVLALGAALLLGGLGLVCALVLPFFAGDRAARERAAGLERELQSSWRQQPQAEVHVVLHRPFAIVRIPRLGRSWSQPVVEGVDERSLASGIGHYPGTQLPGGVGNFAIAGHRVTHGSPFRGLLGVREGDAVVVETGAAVYRYVIDRPASTISVPSSDTSWLDPVPGQPGVTADRALITLTTCTDFFHSADRSVAVGHLVSSRPKRPRRSRPVGTGAGRSGRPVLSARSTSGR